MPKVKKIRISVIIVVTVLAVAAAVRYLPFPTRVNISLHGAEVTKNGTVLEEGEIVIKGWRLNYLFRTDEFEATEFRILDYDFPMGYDNSIVYIDSPVLPYEWISAIMYYPVNGARRMSIYLSPDEDWCVIEMSTVRDPQYFVGSVEENYDPAAILENCADMLS